MHPLGSHRKPRTERGRRNGTRHGKQEPTGTAQDPKNIDKCIAEERNYRSGRFPIGHQTTKGTEMTEARLFGTIAVEFDGDTFTIKDSEWMVAHATFHYSNGHLIDPATDNVFRTREPWVKIEQMINDTDENGFPVDDFGDYEDGYYPDSEIMWEDCEACGDAGIYQTNGRCFSHEED